MVSGPLAGGVGRFLIPSGGSSFRDRLAYTGRTERSLIRPGSGTAVGEPPIHDDRWHRRNPQAFGTRSNLRIVHVQNADLARRASDPVDQPDGEGSKSTARPGPECQRADGNQQDQGCSRQQAGGRLQQESESRSAQHPGHARGAVQDSNSSSRR